LHRQQAFRPAAAELKNPAVALCEEQRPRADGKVPLFDRLLARTTTGSAGITGVTWRCQRNRTFKANAKSRPSSPTT
jgi:hypothetical protein